MPELTGNVLSWASDIDPRSIDQAQRAAALPFIAGHVALMPDAHVGMGATIGSVIPTVGAIIPSAVGVDLGCGMIAAETELTSDDLPDNLDELHTQIGRAVPAGVGRGHDTNRDHELFHQIELSHKEARAARRQLGSLGSGNHFIEVCLDERDHVWIVLHSGSRGVGNQIAQRHIHTAKGLMARYFVELEDPDLAYLAEDTPEFDAYIRDLRWAQNYAYENRDVMMHAVLGELAVFLDRQIRTHPWINCHHNFAELEHHHGRNMWITRKGAIRAREGDLGVIPGSMGTRSYIVEGLGSPASYTSCSHGAGRRMSRTAARKTLDVDTLRREMAGRAWNEYDADELIDEDPRAYKDIDQVMADQGDLVEIRHTLRQILNYKGL